MKSTPSVLLVMTIAVAIFSSVCCDDKTTNPTTQRSPAFSFKSSTCLAVLVKGSLYDSIFVYSFADTLMIDFSVEANCCPDSNRFLVSCISTTDTIDVCVRDTAENGCRCICPYIIHAEIANLPGDLYVVRCAMDSSSGVRNPVHVVTVRRTK